MPCSGVAVATGQIQNDLTEFIKTIDKTVLFTAVEKLLTKQGLDVRAPMMRQGTRLEFPIGDNDFWVTIWIDSNPGVIQVRPRNRQGEAQAQAIQKTLNDLLTGLASITRQRALITKLSKVAKINKQQTAPNGAVVLQVEI